MSNYLTIKKNFFNALFIWLVFFGLFIFVWPVRAQLAEGQDCQCTVQIISSELDCNGTVDFTWPVGQQVNWNDVLLLSAKKLEERLGGTANTECSSIWRLYVATKLYKFTGLPQHEQTIGRYNNCIGFPQRQVKIPVKQGLTRIYPVTIDCSVFEPGEKILCEAAKRVTKSFDYKIMCNGVIEEEQCVAGEFEAECAEAEGPEEKPGTRADIVQKCIKEEITKCLIRKGELCPDGEEPGKFGCSKVAEAIEGLNPLKLSGDTFVQKLQIFIGRIIKYILGFTGSLALAMFVYAGFMYMTARGNSDRISRALRIMTWAGLGTVVVLASYILVDFIFDIF